MNRMTFFLNSPCQRAKRFAIIDFFLSFYKGVTNKVISLPHMNANVRRFRRPRKATKQPEMLLEVR